MPKFELLFHLHSSQEKELFYRRHRELQIFTWSNAILLTISAGLLSSYPNNSLDINIKLVSLRIVITFFVAGITFFSVKWQLYQRQRAARHQQVLSSLLTELGCFNGLESIFPQKWRNWGREYTSLKEHLRFQSKISATLFLGFLCLISCWLDLLVSSRP